MLNDTSTGKGGQGAFSPLASLRAVLSYDAALSEHARIAYLALTKHADSLGVCWPSISTLARECAVSKHTILRALRELEGQGWVLAVRKSGQGSHYQLSIPTGLSQQPVADSNRSLTATGSRQQPVSHSNRLRKATSRSQQPDRLLTATGVVADSDRSIRTTHITAQETDPHKDNLPSGGIRDADARECRSGHEFEKILSEDPFPAERWRGVEKDEARFLWEDWTWDLLERNGLTNEDGVSLPGVTLSFGFEQAWEAWQGGSEHPFLARPAADEQGSNANGPEMPNPSLAQSVSLSAEERGEGAGFAERDSISLDQAEGGTAKRKRKVTGGKKPKSMLGDENARKVAQHAYDLVKALGGGPLPPSWIHRAANTTHSLLKGMEVSPDFLIQCLDWMSQHKYWSGRLAAFRKSGLEQAVVEFRLVQAKERGDSSAQDEAQRQKALRKQMEQELAPRVQAAKEFWLALLRVKLPQEADSPPLRSLKWWDGLPSRPVLKIGRDGELYMAHAYFPDDVVFMRYIDNSCPGWEEFGDEYLEGKREVVLSNGARRSAQDPGV